LSFPILDRFAIDTLEGVNQLMFHKFLDDIQKMPSSKSTTQIGLLRRAMMYSDMDKYFADAWRGAWHGMARESRELLACKWSESKVDSVYETVFRRKKPE